MNNNMKFKTVNHLIKELEMLDGDLEIMNFQIDIKKCYTRNEQFYLDSAAFFDKWLDYTEVNDECKKDCIRLRNTPEYFCKKVVYIKDIHEEMTFEIDSKYRVKELN
jgi:hypothetical protein